MPYPTRHPLYNLCHFLPDFIWDIKRRDLQPPSLKKALQATKDKRWDPGMIDDSNGGILSTLYYLARYSGGTILDMGVYTGGSTIMMHTGLLDSAQDGTYQDRRMISIEASEKFMAAAAGRIKAYTKGPLASNNITLITGFTSENGVTRRVTKYVKDNPIGLMLIDNDGNAHRDLHIYLRYAIPGCVVVIDDYASYWPVNIKTAMSRNTVDKMTKAGVLEPLGVYGLGLWFGVYTGHYIY